MINEDQQQQTGYARYERGIRSVFQDLQQQQQDDASGALAHGASIISSAFALRLAGDHDGAHQTLCAGMDPRDDRSTVYAVEMALEMATVAVQVAATAGQDAAVALMRQAAAGYTEVADRLLAAADDDFPREDYA